jgi:serine/threonine protein kinase
LTDLIRCWQSLPSREREATAGAALYQLAAAVGAFHRLTPPIVHRDLKPANILFATDASPGSGAPIPVLRITDFGIGGVAVEYLRQQNPAASIVSMMTGYLETSLRGSFTPLYASPQQRNGQPPDPRDDVHALGVIAFHIMTGRLAEAPGIDAGEDLHDAGASGGFIALVTKCVATKAERRPRDAAEVTADLSNLTTSAPATPGPPEKPKPMETPPSNPPAAPPAPLANSPSTSPPAADRVPANPVTKSRWLIPLRGVWFTRPAHDPEASWTASPAKLPAEITASSNEVYRLALNPDTTTDAELAKLPALAGLPGLAEIDLTGCRLVSDRGFARLARLRELKSIRLSDTQVTDSALALLLSRLTELEKLDLADADGVTPAMVPYLSRLRRLSRVTLPPRVDTADVRVEFAKRRPGCAVV